MRCWIKGLSYVKADTADCRPTTPFNPPALLLLTGVYRHTGRLEAAEVLLQEISRLEVADGWLLEIETESKRLARAVEAENESDQSDTKNHVSELKDAA